MIWSSVPAMVAIDLAIISGVVLMIVAGRRFGLFERGRQPRTGRLLILGGVLLTALFYLGDLLVMTALPAVIGKAGAMAVMHALHLDVRWLVSVLSLFLISCGVVLSAYHRQRTEKLIEEAEHQAADSTERAVESEIRFRALVAQTPDAVYCFEFRPPVPVDLPVEEQIERSYDAVLVECNEVFARAMEKDSPAAAIGMRFRDMDSARHTVSHTRLFRDFIDKGYRLIDYELSYETPAGEPRALQLSLSGVVNHGKLHRIWGAEKDVLETRLAKTVLAGRLEFQRFVADVSSRLLVATDEQAHNVLQRCLALIAEQVRAERAEISCFDQSSEYAFENLFWSRHDELPYRQPPPRFYPETWRRIQAGIPFAIADTRSLEVEFPIDADTFRKFGVKSMAFVPISVAGGNVGCCVFSNKREWNDWSEQELIDLQVLCNLIASKLVQTTARRSLKLALAEARAAKSRLEAENISLRDEIRSSHSFDEIVGESESLMQCLQQVERVANTATPVLLEGETGTGKELIASAIHKRSGRSDQPMISVNCAAIPTDLVESELFGYEQGAFTGAVSAKAGRFEAADGGTLFLDEIGDLPLELQSKLLRVLQSGEFERLGGDRTRQVDARVIAATNVDLGAAVERGRFRADLYYRIGTYPIRLPPLRARKSDIPLLAEHFVRKHATPLGKSVEAISGLMLEELRRHDWPGNVRELEGIIQRALISSTGPVLELDRPLKSSFAPAVAAEQELYFDVADLRTIEREHITRVLERTGWVVGGDTGAASVLGLPASTLRSKMKKLGIGRPH